MSKRMSAFMAVMLLAVLRLSAAEKPAEEPAEKPAEKPARYQNTSDFSVTVRRVDSADMADILLQCYDAVNGRWVGCGLYHLTRFPGKEVRARIRFTAPAEGAYRLRSIARDSAGNVEFASEGSDDYEIMAVYDATPPSVEMVFPKGGERIEVPGVISVCWIAHDQNIADTSAVRVLFSRDSGLSYEEILSWSDLTESLSWQVPDMSTERAMIAVEVKDLAGNVGRKESGIFALLGSKPAPPPYAGVQTVGPGPPPPVLSEKREWVPPPRPVSTTHPAARASARRYYTRGVIYLVRGDYDEAVKELTSALQADPDFTSARLDLGVALTQMGRVKEGLEFLETSFVEYRGEMGFPYNAGLIYYNTGSYAAAFERFRQALAINPEHTESLWMAADCAARLGKIDDAGRYWLAIIENTRPGNRYHDQARAALEQLGVDVSFVDFPLRGRLLSEPPPVHVREEAAEELPQEVAVKEASRKAPPPPPVLAPEQKLESSGQAFGEMPNLWARPQR